MPPIADTPWTVGLRVWSQGAEDSLGNKPDVYAAPVDRKVYGWAAPRGREPKVAGVEALVVEMELFVPETWSSTENDHVVVDGLEYAQVGPVEDYNHGPFGFTPGGVVNLRRAT